MSNNYDSGIGNANAQNYQSWGGSRTMAEKSNPLDFDTHEKK